MYIDKLKERLGNTRSTATQIAACTEAIEVIEKLEAIRVAGEAYFNPKTEGGAFVEALSYALCDFQTIIPEEEEE